ncbi:MAG: nucleotidyltransferase family protein [Gemmatimonadota bacterium]|nr:MAG: nucleotidyltransferase family protein [Gemmatimonadota bacterium]
MRHLREELLCDAAQEISRALTAREVPHFFARGIALVGTLYAPGDREMADLDLFVQPGSVAAARELVTGLGYVEFPPEEQSGPAALRSSVNLSREGTRSAIESIDLDLHWGLEPITRLLPRPGTEVPDGVWQSLRPGAALPVPAPAHHAALLVHHLAHHDLLHAPALLDLALLRRDEWRTDGDGYEEVARRLGVLRLARAVHWAHVRDFGFAPVAGVRPAPSDRRGRRLEGALVLDRWLAWAGAAGETEHVTVTARRVRRRVLLLDRVTDARLLLVDALFPPREHLRWRWPAARSDAGAWLQHVRQVAGKALGRRS